MGHVPDLGYSAATDNRRPEADVCPLISKFFAAESLLRWTECDSEAFPALLENPLGLAPLAPGTHLLQLQQFVGIPQAAAPKPNLRRHPWKQCLLL